MAWYLLLLVATPLSDKGCSPSRSKLESRKGWLTRYKRQLGYLSQGTRES